MLPGNQSSLYDFQQEMNMKLENISRQTSGGHCQKLAGVLSSSKQIKWMTWSILTMANYSIALPSSCTVVGNHEIIYCIHDTLQNSTPSIALMSQATLLDF